MATKTLTMLSDIGAYLYSETIAGSNEFDVTPFSPSVVQFDIDLDNPSRITNAVLTRIGTPIPLTEINDISTPLEFNSRRYYVLNKDSTKLLKYSADTTTSYYIYNRTRIYTGTTYDVENALSGEIVQSTNFDRSLTSIFIGGIYESSVNRFYLYHRWNTNETSPTIGETASVKVIDNSDDINALIGMFYGGESSDILTLKLVSPGIFFNRGQSSKVVFELSNEAGASVSSNISYECTPNDGWLWDSSTNVLTYTGSTTLWTSVQASTVYNGVSYDANAVFKPPAGTSPYAPGGTSGFGGGNGNFGQDDRNDNVSGDIPGGSNFGYIGGSIFTHYALSGSQAKHFGEWLWTDDLGLSLWKTVMEKLFNETADALVSLMCFPFNISTLPGVSLVDGDIIAGNLNTGIPARVLGSPYVSINWGLVTLNEYWGNFLDYAPHTKLELYLPWSTGFVPLDPHQCVPGSVSVTTNIDLQKGTCTHNVFAGNAVLGVYEGQCGYEIPLLASNFSAKLAGSTVAAVSTVVTAGAAAAVGGASAIASGKALQQVASHNSMIKSMMPGTARNMAGLSGPMTDPGMLASKNFLESQLQMASAPSPIDYSPISHGVGSKIASASSSATAKQPVNISRNGSFSGSSAGMSVPYPFIIISRPEQNVPNGYGHHFGFPSNISSILGQLKGYTEVGAIHLNGLKALPDEIAELDDILKGGFII